MKIAAAIFSIILRLSQATIYEAQYGGCFNTTLYAESNQGRGSAFHCRFTSDSCKDGEDWLSPSEAALNGFKCTCDDDLNQNVFTTACYDMFGTHTVQCASSPSDCPETWYVLGDSNNYDIVHENCTDGSSAYDKGGESCGKQCLCNYAYQTRDNTLEVGSSPYGKCYNPVTNLQYCAATESTCTDGETYHAPHADTLSGPECNCDRAKTGACMTGDDLSYCAVEEDSCADTMTFVKAADLPSDVDCRLCKNTWDAPTVSPAPTDVYTMPPTGTPTAAPTEFVCKDDHTFRHQGKKKKTCKWIDMKKKRTDKLCEKTKVFNACKIVCGRCCADDTRPFNAEGSEKTCDWLWSETRKREQCPRPVVNSICAGTCGRCCSNDSEFTYDTGTAEEPKIKKCGWFKKKKRAKKWCKEAAIAEACQKSCDSCEDYTVPIATPSPTKSPTKAPVKVPSAGGDDD